MSDNARPEIYRRDAASYIWSRYVQSDEYKRQGRVESINSVHPIVRAAEQKGLQKLIKEFIGELKNIPNIRERYEARDRYDWVDEWKSMHDTLFNLVYKKRGSFRVIGEEVRFGLPGDEDLHKIPTGGPSTELEVYELAEKITLQLPYVKRDIESVSTYLAQCHYAFIRIHPFHDGNGRLARAVTDQLAVCLGYPPIIAGFPRTDENRKAKYHKAITGCIGDMMCVSLASWIKAQIEVKIGEIA